jgi:hypothetical protein
MEYFRTRQRKCPVFTFPPCHCTYTCTCHSFIMPFPRLRLDIALGFLIAGTIWYIGTRPRTRQGPTADHVQLSGEDDTNTATAPDPIIEGSLETLKPLLMDPALLERILLLSDPRTMMRVAQVSLTLVKWICRVV